MRGVSFTVRKGEIFGILGPNGAGKTTTLEMVEGLLPPTAGRASVLGFDVARQLNEVKERIGVQLQSSAYHDFLTLYEILDIFGGFYRHQASPDALLDLVGLREKHSSQVRHLSGGQRQRFSIAAALVNDPDIVFLDEPTTGLDPQARHAVWDMIRAIRDDGRTVVLTTHYMEEAEVLCDRVAIMSAGRIVALDAPAALIAEFGGASSVVRLRTAEPLPWLAPPDGATSAANDGTHIYEVPGERPIDTLRELLPRLEAHAAHVIDLTVSRATLEDVFLHLTGHHLDAD